MDIEKFKNESKVTYVHVKGKPTGVIVPRNKQDYSHDDFFYEGFIEVPFNYADFVALSDEQQCAICEVTLCKLGHPIRVSSCCPDLFYNSVKESKYDKKIKSVQELLEQKPDETTKRRLVDIVKEICSSNKDADRAYANRIICLSRSFINKKEFTDITIDYIQPILALMVNNDNFSESRNDIVDIIKQLFNFDVEKGEVIDSY